MLLGGLPYTALNASFHPHHHFRQTTSGFGLVPACQSYAQDIIWPSTPIFIPGARIRKRRIAFVNPNTFTRCRRCNPHQQSVPVPLHCRPKERTGQNTARAQLQGRAVWRRCDNRHAQPTRVNPHVDTEIKVMRIGVRGISWSRRHVSRPTNRPGDNRLLRVGTNQFAGIHKRAFYRIFNAQHPLQSGAMNGVSLGARCGDHQ